jgi:multiple sugar transport system ATP-binding protein
MASVRLEDVVKKYGEVEAVLGMNLDVADGEFMAFLGPSGCGKSSTMRMIAGLEEITSGTIYFDDEPVNKVRPRDRNVAMAFETYALYTTLNVYENLAFPLRSAKWDDKRIDERVREIAGILRITDLLESKTNQLSSGQQQSVGLARALTRAPSVFLLDEPISHLDTRQRSAMRAYLKRIHLDLNHTMIYVTHDQEEAMALSDRIAVMSDGLIRQVGSPEEIYNAPENIFVAGFIGEPPMNFLNCETVSQNGGIHLSHNGTMLTAPSACLELSAQGKMPKEVVLGIRPFYVGIAGEQSEQHSIPASIFVVEPLGDMTVISLDVGQTRVQAVVEPNCGFKAGEKAWLHFEPARTLLFDAGSGQALTVGGA